jgi:hypothetical protein
VDAKVYEFTAHMNRRFGKLVSLRCLCWISLLTVPPEHSVFAAELTNHVIRADEDGIARNPATGRLFQHAASFSAYVNNILARAEEFANTNQSPISSARPVRLLIHVHGGLNDYSDTDRRVHTLADQIMNSPGESFYPIFFSWPSNFKSTYCEHLFSVRQGEKASKWVGYGTSPFILVTDILQVIAQSPRDWFYRFVNHKDRTAASRVIPRSWLSHRWQVAEYNGSNTPSAKIRMGNYYYSSFDRVNNVTLDWLKAPVRATVGTIGQSTIAQNAWEIMNRRTKNLFYPPEVFDLTSTTEKKGAEMIGAGHFFKLLMDRVAARTNGPRYEITFVGHSMGTIVLNKVFTEYHDEWVRNGVIDNIVYMAAACTIGDAKQALLPLLSSLNTNSNQHVRFYNLTLDRIAEIKEPSASGFAPYGSLLEYIDQHLETPQTVLDRTMGSEVNALAAIHVFQPIYQYCEFKAFDRYPNWIPQRHGDFNLCPFWEKAFWSSDTLTFHLDNKPALYLNSYPRDWQIHPRH